MHTRSIRPHSPYEIACWACVIGWLKFVHFVTGGPFGLHGFGRFAGLLREDLQQHGVIDLIVLGFAAAGICGDAVLLRGSTAGKAFRAIRMDPLLAQSQGTNVSASKLCASERSIPALPVPAYAPVSMAG